MPRGRSLAGLGGRLPGGSPGNLSARVREAGLPSFQAHGIRVTSLTSGNHLGRKIFFLAEQKSSRFLWTKKKKMSRSYSAGFCGGPLRRRWPCLSWFLSHAEYTRSFHTNALSPDHN